MSDQLNAGGRVDCLIEVMSKCEVNGWETVDCRIELNYEGRWVGAGEVDLSCIQK